MKLSTKSLGHSLGAILLLGSFSCLPAQQQRQSTAIQPDDTDVVRITTNLVQVDAVVTDRDGRVVANLTPGDFNLSVNGRQQQITNFSFAATKRTLSATETQGPPPEGWYARQINNTFALVIDDYCMSFESFASARRLAREFINERLQSHDAAAVISTRLGTGTLQQFTTDRRLLNAAIENLRWRPCRKAETSSSAPSGSDDGAITRANSARERDSFDRNAYGITALGTLEYVAHGLADLPGRKAVLMLSEGLPILSPNTGESGGDVLERLRRVIEKANRASAAVYTIHLRGLDPLFFDINDGPNPIRSAAMSADRGLLAAKRKEFNSGQDGLISLAESTGGIAVRNTNDFSGGLLRAVEDQQGYYLIGYHPDANTFDESGGARKFNSLKISLNNRPGYRVRTRHGFSSQVLPKPSPSVTTGADQLIRALRSPVGSDGLALRMTALLTNKTPAGWQVRSLLHLDAHNLSFRPVKDGWLLAMIDVVFVTLDASGSIVDQLTRSQTVRVREDKFEQIVSEGLIYVLDVPVRKSGPYEVRVAVRDHGSARVGSARQFIEVPDPKRDGLVVAALVVSGRPGGTRDRSDGRSTSLPLDGVAELASPEGPAVRRFKKNMTVDYGFEIYGANQRRDRELTTQIRLFSNGREIFAGQPQQFSPVQSHEMFIASGSFQLGESFPKGWCTLEISVSDPTRRKQSSAGSQWVDFEVVD